MSRCVAVLCCVIGVATAIRPASVPIGGLFDPEHSDYQDIVFNYAVDRINTALSQKGSDKDGLCSRLIPFIVNVSNSNSFLTGRRLCDMTVYGVTAVFGPQSQTTSGIVRGICDNLKIPNLETIWDPDPKPSDFLLNLHPDAQSLAKALKDVVVNVLHWKSYAILYDSEYGLIRLQEIIKLRDPGDKPITLLQLDPDGDNRPLLKAMHASRITHIILDCDVRNIPKYFREANDVNMLREYVNYFITSLDTHTIDLSEFGRPVNITAVQMVDPKSAEVTSAIEDWKRRRGYQENRLTFDARTVKLETALIYDAVHLFAKALHQLETTQRIKIRKMSCLSNNTWQHGPTLVDYMKQMETIGMTGIVKFNPAGRRVDFDLNVVEYATEEFKKIATWEPHKGIIHTRSSSDIAKQVSQNIQNKTFIVSSKTGLPYLEKKMPYEGRSGNDRYEGYAVDLITKIAEILKIKFEFRLTDDNTYPGLIKDLQDQKADLAICDLTITYEREKIVDFTMPFMELGISILFAKPTVQSPSLFSFLDPLSTEVWLLMATAYLGISVLLYVLARASSQEWSSAHPCLAEPEELENKITMINSLWHNVGSMLQQGSDVAPQAVATRAVAAMWWFFILIMISSYIANLAAYLTLTRSDNLITSVDDLANQNKIKYGTVRKGSTKSFFQNSNQSIFQRIYRTMEETRPSGYAVDNKEGVERVKKGKTLYAFFMESTQIEYETERNCNLTKIGGQLDRKGYGIALPLHSPYRSLINEAVLKLQEKGELRKLKNKWWKEMGGAGGCKTSTAVKVDNNELGMPNVGGVFLVLLMGCVTALIVAILEMVWNCRKIAVEEAITPWEALVLELKFAIRFSETKPVRKKIARLDKSKTSSAISLDFDKYPNK